MKKSKIIFCICLLVILCCNCIISFGTFEPGVFHPEPGNTKQLNQKIKPILGYMQTIAIFISVGAVIVLGIKFVTSSPEGKAQVKDQLIPVVIGIVIILGITTILKAIASILEKANFT